MVTKAHPFRSKRVVGPHVVAPQKKPVCIHSDIHDVHEDVTYQWVCKYCGESEWCIEGFSRFPKDCNGVEWLESELVAQRAERKEA